MECLERLESYRAKLEELFHLPSWLLFGFALSRVESHIAEARRANSFSTEKNRDFQDLNISY